MSEEERRRVSWIRFHKWLGVVALASALVTFAGVMHDAWRFYFGVAALAIGLEQMQRAWDGAV